jgi:putative ABC transport system substrate-binding protein
LFGLDPVGSGLVASLARPGGNVTGLSMQSTDLVGKRIELLREMVPGLRRLAVLVNVGNTSSVLEISEVQAKAVALGLEILLLEIRGPHEIASTFSMLKGQPDALYIIPDAFLQHVPIIVVHSLHA